VDHQVHAHGQRAQVAGRAKGRIDDGKEPSTVGQRGQLLQVDDPQIGVGGRLGEDQPRVGADGLFEGLHIVDGRQRASDIQSRHDLLPELARTSVAVVGHDIVVARAEKGQQRQRRGRHARAEHAGGVAALESRQLSFDGAGVGAAIARIFAAQQGQPLLFALHVRHQRGRVLKAISRGLYDGRGNGAIGVGPGLASVHSLRVDAAKRGLIGAHVGLLAVAAPGSRHGGLPGPGRPG
jgi:hypothetical protein